MQDTIDELRGKISDFVRDYILFLARGQVALVVADAHPLQVLADSGSDVSAQSFFSMKAEFKPARFGGKCARIDVR